MQIVDMITTHIFISMGHKEGNPIMAAIIEQGWGYAWLLKILVMFLIPSIATHHRKATLFLLYFYSGVILNNALAILYLLTYGQ